MQRYNSVSVNIVTLFWRTFWRDNTVLNLHASCFHEFASDHFSLNILARLQDSFLSFNCEGTYFSIADRLTWLLRSSVCGWSCHLISQQLPHIPTGSWQQLQPFFVGKTYPWHLILMCGLMWELSWEKIFSISLMLSLSDSPASLTLIICLFFLFTVQNSEQLQTFRVTSTKHIQTFLSNSFPCFQLFDSPGNVVVRYFTSIRLLFMVHSGRWFLKSDCCLESGCTRHYGKESTFKQSTTQDL